MHYAQPLPFRKQFARELPPTQHASIGVLDDDSLAHVLGFLDARDLCSFASSANAARTHISVKRSWSMLARDVRGAVFCPKLSDRMLSIMAYSANHFLATSYNPSKSRPGSREASIYGTRTCRTCGELVAINTRVFHCPENYFYFARLHNHRGAILWESFLPTMSCDDTRRERFWFSFEKLRVDAPQAHVIFHDYMTTVGDNQQHLSNHKMTLSVIAFCRQDLSARPTLLMRNNTSATRLLSFMSMQGEDEAPASLRCPFRKRHCYEAITEKNMWISAEMRANGTHSTRFFALCIDVEGLHRPTSELSWYRTPHDSDTDTS